MEFVTTGSAKISSIRCCILYDSKDGTIRHLHRVVTMQGAPETSESDMEKQTIELAKDLSLDTGQLQVLHVDQSVISERARYSVDPKSRTLVKQKPVEIPGLPKS
jgi:hypothetical protein